MKIFLVGGAVRDKLLKIPNADKDYLVVGSTEEEMKKLGFIQVAKDFPVFLHPVTKREYALARTEKKDGTGYKGFKVQFEPMVSLEEDLYRRDLTINAMALDEEGNLHDPYSGRKDLQDRVLRHVSDHFKDDPLRVLRIFRFKASLYHLNFKIADETKKIISDVIASGELESLSGGRLLLELKKVCSTPSPHIFFEESHSFNLFQHVFTFLQKVDVSCYQKMLKIKQKALEPKNELLVFFSFLAVHLNEEDLQTMERTLPLPNISKSMNRYVQKWFFALENMERLTVNEKHAAIIETGSIKGKDNILLLWETLDVLAFTLEKDIHLNMLKELSYILQHYNYGKSFQETKTKEDIQTLKKRIQMELILEYGNKSR